MITIDDQEWALLREAAQHVGVSHMAMKKWVYRHRQEVRTRKVGTALVVLVGDLQGYRKAAPRKEVAR